MDIKLMDVDIDELDRAIKGDPDGLVEAFCWRDSKQGTEYWTRQYDRKCPLDIEALKEIREAYYKSKGEQLPGDKAPKTAEEHPAEMAARLNILIKVQVGDFYWTFDGRKTDGE